MEEIAASASKGVINPLLSKLTKLVMGGLIGISQDTAFLRDELRTMNALLEKLEGKDKLDPQVKEWKNQVREMTYDIEDCVDDYVQSVGSADAKAGFINKVSHFLKTLRSRLEIANQIKELKTRLQDINERRKRYKIEDWIPSTTSVTVDPRLPALYKEAASLVGIESPRKDLVELLTNSGKALKVISIVGFGDLGKTTLAKEVTRAIGEKYECKSFVSVSQRPDIPRLLNRIHSKLGIGGSSSSWEVQDIIDGIRGYLKRKRNQSRVCCSGQYKARKASYGTRFLMSQSIGSRRQKKLLHHPAPDGNPLLGSRRVRKFSSWHGK